MNNLKYIFIMMNEIELYDFKLNLKKKQFKSQFQQLLLKIIVIGPFLLLLLLF